MEPWQFKTVIDKLNEILEEESGGDE